MTEPEPEYEFERFPEILSAEMRARRLARAEKNLARWERRLKRAAAVYAGLQTRSGNRPAKGRAEWSLRYARANAKVAEWRRKVQRLGGSTAAW